MSKQVIDIKNVILSVNKELGFTVVRDMLSLEQKMIGNILTEELEEKDSLVNIKIEIEYLPSNKITKREIHY